MSRLDRLRPPSDQDQSASSGTSRARPGGLGPAYTRGMAAFPAELAPTSLDVTPRPDYRSCEASVFR
jgi:hypothetical protein